MLNFHIFLNLSFFNLHSHSSQRNVLFGRNGLHVHFLFLSMLIVRINYYFGPFMTKQIHSFSLS